MVRRGIHSLASSPSLSLLLHWVNTLPPTSCLLVSDPKDLQDGQVLCNLVVECLLPRHHAVSSLDKALRLLEHYHATQFPSLFAALYDKYDVEELVWLVEQGNERVLTKLLKVLRVLWEEEGLHCRVRRMKEEEREAAPSASRCRNGTSGSRNGSKSRRKVKTVTKMDEEEVEAMEDRHGGRDSRTFASRESAARPAYHPHPHAPYHHHINYPSSRKGVEEESIPEKVPGEAQSRRRSPLPLSTSLVSSSSSPSSPSTTNAQRRMGIHGAGNDAIMPSHPAAAVSHQNGQKRTPSERPRRTGQANSLSGSSKRSSSRSTTSSSSGSPRSNRKPPASIPPISKQQRVSVCTWLSLLPLPLPSRLSLSPPLPDTGRGGRSREGGREGVTDSGLPQQQPRSSPPSLPLERDPFRNGHLLCALFIHLEPDIASHTKGLHELLQNDLVSSLSSPLHRARERVACALWLFRCRTCPPIASFYFNDIDGVLRGDPDTIYGLLWELQQVYALSPFLPPSLCHVQQRKEETGEYRAASLISGLHTSPPPAAAGEGGGRRG